MVFAALCAVAGVLFLLCGGKDRGAVSLDDGARTVRLASRTITVPCTRPGGTQNAAPPPQSNPPTFSRRGTAPFVVISNGRVTKAVRKRAAACGARVTGVIPPHGIVVEATAAAIARIRADETFAAAEALTVSDRMSASLKHLLAVGGGVPIAVTVIPLATDDVSEIVAFLAGQGVTAEDISVKGRGRVRAVIPASAVVPLAERGDVRWMEHYVRPRLLNDVAVQPGLMNVTPVRDVQGLTGRGQVVTLSDSGLDTGDPATLMADFTNRIVFIGTVEGCQSYDSLGHGTHVAGSLAGDGSLSGGAFKGIACGAMLNVWQCFAEDGYLYVPDLDKLFQPAHADSPSYIHSGSWGGGEPSEYDSDCIGTDGWMWGHPENLSAFAAGNAGKPRTILSPAGAKNVIAVGGTENLRPEKGTKADNPSQIASFSSQGPMKDGRIKPDLCAPGSYILSTRSTRTSKEGWGLYAENGHYMFDGGTSMATPMVSGSAALVRQWLVERRGCTNEMPSAALMKAVMTGGAYDMVGDSGANCGGAAPNSVQGWGRVDLGESLYPTNAAVKLVDRLPFADGETFSVRVTTTNASPFSVQLVWTDYPGAYGAAQSLVNDLDLVVSNETTGAVWYGNGAVGGDHTNNVESVRIASAGAATYSVMVRGTNVPYDSVAGGAAALYVRGAFGEDDAQDVWNGDVRGDILIRSYRLIPSFGNYYWDYIDMRAQHGEILHFTVPESVPGGSEMFDLSAEQKSYTDEDGTYKPMTMQRLGRIEIAERDADMGEPVVDANGYMATGFSVVADEDKDILYYFYDEASTNVATTLPTWWYQRYVAENPVADVVRFVSVSPERVEWIGGAGARRILERTAALGVEEGWRPVYTNAPEPVLTNGWDVPVEFSTNSFYRIR